MVSGAEGDGTGVGRPRRASGSGTGVGWPRRAEDSLRPVRSILPRRATLLKTALVAALLATAAGILWLPETEGPATGTSSSRSPGSSGSSGPLGQPVRPEDGVASGGTSTSDVAQPASGATVPPGAGRPPATPALTPALPAGTVGVPVRMADPAVLAVVRSGARVDLMLVPAAGNAPPTMLAGAALVLDVVHPDPVDGSGALYLALTPEQAQHVVAAPPDARFAVVVRS